MSFEINDSPRKNDLNNYRELIKLPFKYINCKIGLLIGANNPDIINPLKIFHTSARGAYATKHYFGWGLNGPTNGSVHEHVKCMKTSIQSELKDLDSNFDHCFSEDSIDDENSETTPSFDDLLMKKVFQKVFKNYLIIILRSDCQKI